MSSTLTQHEHIRFVAMWFTPPQLSQNSGGQLLQ